MKTALAWASFLLAAMLALDVHFQLERFVEAKIKNDSAIARDTKRIADILSGGAAAESEAKFLARGRKDVEDMDALADEVVRETDRKLCAKAKKDHDLLRMQILSCPPEDVRAERTRRQGQALDRMMERL